MTINNLLRTLGQPYEQHQEPHDTIVPKHRNSSNQLMKECFLMGTAFPKCNQWLVSQKCQHLIMI